MHHPLRVLEPTTQQETGHHYQNLIDVLSNEVYYDQPHQISHRLRKPRLLNLGSTEQSINVIQQQRQIGPLENAYAFDPVQELTRIRNQEEEFKKDPIKNKRVNPLRPKDIAQEEPKNGLIKFFSKVFSSKQKKPSEELPSYSSLPQETYYPSALDNSNSLQQKQLAFASQMFIPDNKQLISGYVPQNFNSQHLLLPVTNFHDSADLHKREEQSEQPFTFHNDDQANMTFNRKHTLQVEDPYIIAPQSEDRRFTINRVSEISEPKRQNSLARWDEPRRKFQGEEIQDMIRKIKEDDSRKKVTLRKNATQLIEIQKASSSELRSKTVRRNEKLPEIAGERVKNLTIQNMYFDIKNNQVQGYDGSGLEGLMSLKNEASQKKFIDAIAKLNKHPVWRKHMAAKKEQKSESLVGLAKAQSQFVNFKIATQSQSKEYPVERYLKLKQLIQEGRMARTPERVGGSESRSELNRNSSKSGLYLTSSRRQSKLDLTPYGIKTKRRRSQIPKRQSKIKLRRLEETRNIDQQSTLNKDSSFSVLPNNGGLSRFTFNTQSTDSLEKTKEVSNMNIDEAMIRILNHLDPSQSSGMLQLTNEEQIKLALSKLCRASDQQQMPYYEGRSILYNQVVKDQSSVDLKEDVVLNIPLKNIHQFHPIFSGFPLNGVRFIISNFCEIIFCRKFQILYNENDANQNFYIPLYGLLSLKSNKKGLIVEKVDSSSPIGEEVLFDTTYINRPETCFAESDCALLSFSRYSWVKARETAVQKRKKLGQPPDSQVLWAITMLDELLRTSFFEKRKLRIQKPSPIQSKRSTPLKESSSNYFTSPVKVKLPHSLNRQQQ